ncbi:MAG: GNAT family N-acetyltransferase [Chloroflexia bacterium]|nr:GNAT family N-acetyltransferase [Chloroflexia bacterium]
MYLIETERLALRELDLIDLESLHEILGDSATMKYYPSTYSLEEVKSWLSRNIESYEKHSFGLWAMVLKGEETFIGQCGISMQDIDEELVPEIGYHINRNFWNKGYATEAANACMPYGFNNLDLESIYIHTYVKNIPSQRIAEKIGMKRIKVYDKHIKNHNVTWQHVVFRVNKSELIYDLKVS